MGNIISCLVKLLLVAAVMICVLLVGFIYISGPTINNPTTYLKTPDPAHPLNIKPTELISTPTGFQRPADQGNYTAPIGTKVEGIGVITNSFALLGTEKLEFVTGYTVQFPDDVNLSSYNLTHHPELILSMLVTGMKAAGIDNQENLPNLEGIGDESVGLTLTTTREGMKLRIDAVIFRRGKMGALAAVIYSDGQKPSAYVGDIARQMDTHIQNSK